jgi:hypothetical protein
MMMNEYLNQFIQLSRYTTNDVSTNEKKQDTFLKGLNDKIQFRLLNTDYLNFQQLVDKAIIIENKLKEMENDGKRKMVFLSQHIRSNARPRLSQPSQFTRTPYPSRAPMQVPRPQFQNQCFYFPMQRSGYPVFHSQLQATHPVLQQSRQNVQHVSHLVAQHQQNAVPPGGQAFNACFKCGLPAHMAKNCPTR